MTPRSIVHLGKLFCQAWFGQNEEAQFELLGKIARRLYPRYKLSDYGRMYLYDEAFIKRYERLMENDNYFSLDRKYMLDQLMGLTAAVPGNTAECGVYQGASSRFICERTAGQERVHRICDSFEGLSSIESIDGRYWSQGKFANSEENVRRNLTDFDFVTFHKGWIPECFRGLEEDRFAFVHIDVDLYQPTLDSFRFFYPRMNRGGVMLCDDSGCILTCPGARKAVDEFFSDKPEPVIEVPTGQSFVIKS